MQNIEEEIKPKKYTRADRRKSSLDSNLLYSHDFNEFKK